ncbi:MAG TPA: hypothetical protein VGT61_02365 [Thermomicrobiales bacterium]|jgi:hypothetical protein|nr:hypothetical protein [Thermomicrobiales bacterium]
MNDVTGHTIATSYASAATADRAITAWSWYYVYFTEARLASGEVVLH